MILQTGNRTDLPAFYSTWLANRIREGYVMVRNPFNPVSVTRYRIDPSVVDLIVFCTKNPAPMLEHMGLLRPFRQYWFVTITPYGKDIEPHVPDKDLVIESFRRLCGHVGPDCMCWRYDPVFIDSSWTVQRHVEAFSAMCRKLEGSTHTCVISYIDLYEKVLRNFPEVRSVPFDIQMELTKTFVEIAAEHDMIIKPCGEDPQLASAGADCSGCMTQQTFEQAVRQNLILPPNPGNRKECACYITNDIGQYNTCGHLCRYCYANADKETVRRNMRLHDSSSPLLIGNLRPEDKVHEAKQKSWIDMQMRLF